MINRIAQSIVNEKESKNILKEQHALLKESCGIVERSMKNQEQLYHDLQAKFIMWENLMAATLKYEQQKCEVQQKKMQLQIEKKQQYLQRRHVIEKELPSLLMETKQALYQKFQQDQNLGKSYITKVLRALHE